MTYLILLIVAFLICSGILAAVDAALLSITRPEIHELIRHGKTGAVALQTVNERFRRSVVVIVIVTNIVNVMGPILVTQESVRSQGQSGLTVIAIVLMLGSMTVSEIIPKAMGAHYAPLISRVAAPVIQTLQLVLFPIVVSLEWLSGHFTAGTRRIGTEDQIRFLTRMGERAGYIQENEGDLIHKAFLLNDRSAAEIMTPIEHVVGLSATQTIADAATTVRHSIYSRYPVFGNGRNDISGVVIIRDILEAAAEGRQNEPVEVLTHPSLYVSADMRSDELLMAFRNRRMHLAIVRERRQTIGVVSLEDVLEELVGEIVDEKDAELVDGSSD